MKNFDTRKWLGGLGLGLSTWLLAAAPVLSQDRQTLTWTEAINQALSANQSLAAAQADLEATKEDISIARANFLPSFGVGGALSTSKAATFSETSGVLPSTTGLVGASLTQMIYNEKFFANHTVQKELYASQEEQLRNTRYGIIAGAGQAYIGVLLAEQLLDVQIVNREVTEQHLQSSRDREQVGATSLQEVLRFQTQLYANEQQVAGQRANVLMNRIALNQVRDRPAEEVDVLEKLSVEKDGFIFSSSVVAEALANEDKARIVRDYLVELGLASSPALASLDREIAAQQRQLSSEKRWLIPSLSFTAGADAFVLTSGVGEEEAQKKKGFWKLGVNLSWPIFEGGANLSKVDQSESEIRALASQRKELETSLEQAIRATVGVAISDYQKIGLARSQAEAAEQNYLLVYDSYLVGEISLLDLLDAQEQKLNAASSATVALYTFFADLLSVEQAIGYFPFLEPQDQVDKIIRELESRLQGS
jgi:multidrug efflux system outer membrane protein